MKIRIAIITLFFLGTVFSLNAQNSEMILGKWAFEDAAPEDKAKMDSVGLKMLNMFFGDLSLYFRKDGSYKMVMMGRADEGQWNWVKEPKSIKLNSNKGEGMQIDVLELTDMTLVIKLPKGAFVLKKVSPLAEDDVVKEVVRIEGVSASMDQVTKKWYFKSREIEEEDQQLEIVDELMKGAYIQLNKNGTYKAQIVGINDKANWKLSEDKKAIIIASDGIEKNWIIQSVTETTLVLILGSNETWVFSTVQ
jgi:hypothetical protein